ncbi:MAG: NAD(P)H-binding protein [Microbispora sp.]|nr:NAD(P)H-binding protein [Microbispora sp.]
MRVVIAGGHGKIALRLARLLSGRGDAPVGLIRNPDQIADVEAAGAEAVVCDLERATLEEVAETLLGAGAVVFAAGAGPGSGAARKFSMDQGGSVLLAEAAQRAGVPRFIQISTMGAGAPPDPGRGEVWAAYIAAKTAAEEDLRARPLDWTILRPGRLTDEPGSGLVTLADPPLPPGEVSRDDVAAVIAALLDEPRTRHRVLDLIGGGVPIDEAVRLVLMR